MTNQKKNKDWKDEWCKQFEAKSLDRDKVLIFIESSLKEQRKEFVADLKRIDRMSKYDPDVMLLEYSKLIQKYDKNS